MAIDVLITSHQVTSEAKQAISKLRYMFQIRGLVVSEDKAAAGDGALTALADAARDATSVLVILDTTATPEDTHRKAWLDWVDRTHSSSNRSVVLVSASGPPQRTWLPEKLRGEPITRLDRPLGFQRVFFRLGMPPLIGTRPVDITRLELGYVDDTIMNKDGLERMPLVGYVAGMIRGSKSGMTISVEGPWGSGKSWFVNKLRAKLKASPDKLEARESRHAPIIRIVEFNPWRLDKADSLWASFALAFYEQLYQFHPRLLLDPRRRGEALADLLARGKLAWKRYDIRTGSRPLLKLAVMLVAIVVCVVALFEPQYIRENFRDRISELADNPKQTPPSKENDKTKDGALQLLAAFLLLPSFAGIFRFLWSMKPTAILKDIASNAKGPDYEGKRPFIQQFQEDFANVREAFSHCRVIVIIDDIDRCEPAAAAELCQAINLMIPESSDIVFIIAMDREKIAAGLAARAEKILPILAAGRDGGRGFDGARALDYGFQFLEKSVQLSVRLPPARADSLHKIIPLSSSTPQKERKEFSELIERVAPVLGNNPRRLKHFLNVMNLNTHLLETGDEPAVTRSQLAKLLAITLRWPRLVPELANEPKLLAELEEFAVDRNARILGTTPDSAFARWAREEDLLDLLAGGLDRDISPENATSLTFLGVDVCRLLGARRTLPILTSTNATANLSEE